MIDWLRYRFEIRRLWVKEQSATRDYVRGVERYKNEHPEAIDTILSENGYDVLERFNHSWNVQLRNIRDEIRLLTSEYFVRRAAKLVIPVPDDWQEVGILDRRLSLTPNALHELRAKVRAEERDRTDMFFKFAAALTGVIGVTIGLVSVLKK